MRSKEEIKKIREQARAALKNDFLTEKKLEKRNTPKKFGKGSFGK